MLEINEDDAFSLGLALNRHRRHLTPEQHKQILQDLHQDKEQTRRLAVALRRSGMTQEQVAEELGVSHKTIDLWEGGDESRSTITNPSKPDWRVKLSPENKLILVEKAQTGENQKVLADEYKISQQRVSQIVNAYEKQQAKAAAVAARSAPLLLHIILEKDGVVGVCANLEVDLLLVRIDHKVEILVGVAVPITDHAGEGSHRVAHRAQSVNLQKPLHELVLRIDL
jgi:DNA-binding XRE family transcriptional regulator